LDPFAVVAAVGDPMQPVVAGMALSASRRVGVLLAGGTQMLAVYSLMQRLVRQGSRGNLEQVAVGTTRWVAEDVTGDTVGLAKTLKDVPLFATGLSFATSHYPQLKAYEEGYVKEGVGAGGCAIASHLYLGWSQAQLLSAIEQLLQQYAQIH
jgi:NaMN:DMB phosphoribosyltransferase